MNKRQRNDIVKILHRVRARLADESRWTKDDFARDSPYSYGFEVPPRSKHAVCWCLEGAIDRETKCLAWETRNALKNCLPERNTLAGFNDANTTTHTDILLLLDRTISELSDYAQKGL